MSNTYMLPPVVFAFVPGMGTVVSKRTAPPSRSIEDASVASIAAAKILTAVHNNVRFLSIASLPCFFFEPVLSARRDHCPFLVGFQLQVYVEKIFWNCDSGAWNSTSVWRFIASPRTAPGACGVAGTFLSHAD